MAGALKKDALGTLVGPANRIAVATSQVPAPHTLPETNSQPTPENGPQRPKRKPDHLNQPSRNSGAFAVSFRECKFPHHINEFQETSKNPTTHVTSFMLRTQSDSEMMQEICVFFCWAVYQLMVFLVGLGPGGSDYIL